MRRLPWVGILLIALYAAVSVIFLEPVSPEERAFDFFSSLLARTGRIAYRPEGDDRFGAPGFVPRGFEYGRRPGRSGEAFPGTPPGFILAWAAVKAVFPPQLSRLINPLCAAVSLALLHRSALRFLGGERASAAAATLALATTPLFVRSAVRGGDDAFNLACYLGLMTLLPAASGPPSRWRWPAAGVLAGWLLWVRPANAVYLLPLILLVLPGQWGAARRGFLRALLAAIAVAALLVLFLAHCSGGGLPIPGWGGLAVLLRARFGEGLLRAKSAPILLALGFPLLPFALLGWARFPPAPQFRAFFAGQASLAIAFFALAPAPSPPWAETALGSPFLRGLLPLTALLCLFAGRSLGGGRAPDRRPLAAALAFNALFALLGPSGLVETAALSAQARAATSYLLDAAPADGVVFTRRWDAAAFPNRTVFAADPRRAKSAYLRAVDRAREKARPIFTTTHPADREVREDLEARFRWREIPGPRTPPVLARAAAYFPPGDRLPSLVAASPPLACVTDIDGTITGKKAPDSRARKRITLPRGRETLWWIYGQGVEIIYLSSRNPEAFDFTLDLLHDYPPGEIILMADRRETVRAYKTRSIREIQEGFRVVFGIGDSDVDMAAYEDCGVPALRLRPSVNERWKEIWGEIECLIAAEGNPPRAAPARGSPAAWR